VGIGVNQAREMVWVLARGGEGARTGLANKLRINRDRLATNNAEQAQRGADSVVRRGRDPATPAEARAVRGLAASP
jgi:uncharacterized protein (DUF849 family)